MFECYHVPLKGVLEGTLLLLRWREHRRAGSDARLGSTLQLLRKRSVWTLGMAALKDKVFFCGVCCSELTDPDRSSFTACGHLLCSPCYKTPNMCPVCNQASQILSISQVEKNPSYGVLFQSVPAMLKQATATLQASAHACTKSQAIRLLSFPFNLSFPTRDSNLFSSAQFQVQQFQIIRTKQNEKIQHLENKTAVLEQSHAAKCSELRCAARHSINSLLQSVSCLQI